MGQTINIRKRIIIRADANKDIAMGHIMRCLSLADAFRARGNDVTFVCASYDATKLLEGRGYRGIVTETDYSNPDSEFVSGNYKRMLESINPDVILLDSYFIKDSYIAKLREYSDAKIAYMDDFANYCPKVDILINYNAYGEYTPYESMYKNASVKLPKLILGPSYAPLRQEFEKPPKHAASDRFEVLLSTGGADLTHVAIDFVKRFNREISENKYENIRLNVLVGPFSEDREALIKEASLNPDHIVIHSNITDMSGFLSKFDLALSAAGSTTYELCAMGIPTVLFCTADNQLKIHDAFKSNKKLITAGSTETDKEGVIDRLYEAMERLSGDLDECKRLSGLAKTVTDGYGAKRLSDAIINSL